LGVKFHTSVAAMMPGMTLTRNSQCQLMFSVSQPPSVGPMDGASVATIPMATCWSIERLGPNSVNAAAIVVGIIAAPTKPWMQRNTIRLLRSHAKAHSTLANVKPAAENTNSRRIDSARFSRPDSGMPITSAIR
jgi:hypothetical protein